MSKNYDPENNVNDLADVAEAFRMMYIVSLEEGSKRFNPLQEYIEKLELIYNQLHEEVKRIDDILHTWLYTDVTDTSEEKFMYALGRIMGLDHATIDEIIDQELSNAAGPDGE